MKRFYFDTSVLITLIRIGYAELLADLEGEVFVPDAVASELITPDSISDEGQTAELDRLNELSNAGKLELGTPADLIGGQPSHTALKRASQHLGKNEVNDSDITGDVSLLAIGLADDASVIVTDDKPLRKACKQLGIPVSGSIGLLVIAVKRRSLEPEQAKEALVAMDEVGARLSASLLRKAERLIDKAAD